MRTETVQSKITPDERAKLEASAERQATTVSQLLRRLVLEHLRGLETDRGTRSVWD